MDILNIDKDKINNIATAMALLAESLNDATVRDLESPGEDQDMFQAKKEENRKRDMILDFIKELSEQVANHVIEKQRDVIDITPDETGVYTVNNQPEKENTGPTVTDTQTDPMQLETKPIAPVDGEITKELIQSNIKLDSIEDSTKDTVEYVNLVDDTLRERLSIPDTATEKQSLVPESIEVSVTDIDNDTLKKMSVSIAMALTKAQLDMERRRKRGFGDSQNQATDEEDGFFSDVTGLLGIGAAGLVASKFLPVGFGGSKPSTSKGGRPGGLGYPKPGSAPKSTIPKGLGRLGWLAALLSVVDVADTALDTTKTSDEKNVEYAGTAGALSGMIAGGKLGAAMGAYLGPWGAAIGGIIGASAGAIFGEKAAESLTTYVQSDSLADDLNKLFDLTNPELAGKMEDQAKLIASDQQSELKGENSAFPDYKDPEIRKNLSPSQLETIALAEKEKIFTSPIVEAQHPTQVKRGKRKNVTLSMEAWADQIEDKVEDDLKVVQDKFKNLLREGYVTPTRTGKKSKLDFVQPVKVDGQSRLNIDYDKLESFMVNELSKSKDEIWEWAAALGVDSDANLLEALERSIPESEKTTEQMKNRAMAKAFADYIKAATPKGVGFSRNKGGTFLKVNVATGDAVEQESLRRAAQFEVINMPATAGRFATKFDAGVAKFGDENALTPKTLSNLQEGLAQAKQQDDTERIEQLNFQFDSIIKDYDRFISPTIPAYGSSYSDVQKAQAQGLKTSDLGKLIQEIKLSRLKEQYPERFMAPDDQDKQKQLDMMAQAILDKPDILDAKTIAEVMDDVEFILNESGELEAKSKSDNRLLQYILDEYKRQQQQSKAEPFQLGPKRMKTRAQPLRTGKSFISQSGDGIKNTLRPDSKLYNKLYRDGQVFEVSENYKQRFIDPSTGKFRNPNTDLSPVKLETRETKPTPWVPPTAEKIFSPPEKDQSPAIYPQPVWESNSKETEDYVQELIIMAPEPAQPATVDNKPVVEAIDRNTSALQEFFSKPINSQSDQQSAPQNNVINVKNNNSSVKYTSHSERPADYRERVIRRNKRN